MKQVMQSIKTGGWLAVSLLVLSVSGVPGAEFKPAEPGSRGVLIRLGQEKDAAICFDAELLRASGAGTGKFPSAVAAMPRAEFSAGLGTPIFTTTNRPGWGSMANLKDPRAKPEGPLPAEWGKYLGLYAAGDQTVLSYTVWNCPVLELPEYNSTNGVLSRTFAFEKSGVAMALLVCTAPPHDGKIDYIEKVGNGQYGYIALNNFVAQSATNVTTAAAIQGAPKEASWEIVDGHLYLRLPPMDQPTKFRLSIWKGDKDEGLTQFIEYVAKNKVIADPKALTGR